MNSWSSLTKWKSTCLYYRWNSSSRWSRKASGWVGVGGGGNIHVAVTGCSLTCRVMSWCTLEWQVLLCLAEYITHMTCNLVSAWCTLTRHVVLCRCVHSPDMWCDVGVYTHQTCDVMYTHLTCHVMVYIRMTVVVCTNLHVMCIWVNTHVSCNIWWRCTVTWHVIWCLRCIHSPDMSYDVRVHTHVACDVVVYTHMKGDVVLCTHTWFLMWCRGLYSLDIWFDVVIYTHMTGDVVWCTLTWQMMYILVYIFTWQVMWCLGVHYFDMLCDVVVLDHVTCDVGLYTQLSCDMMSRCIPDC